MPARILTVGYAGNDQGAIYVGQYGQRQFDGGPTVATLPFLARNDRGTNGQGGRPGPVLTEPYCYRFRLAAPDHPNGIMVGDAGAGTLTVANGAEVLDVGDDGNGNGLTIANQFGSTGNVYVTRHWHIT